MATSIEPAILQLAQSGTVYDLGAEISPRIPMLPNNILMPFSLVTYRSPEGIEKDMPEMQGVTFHMDAIAGSMHMSTHIDAFPHYQKDGRIHGGHLAREVRGDFGWEEHGVETIAPIVSRGVLLDVARFLDVDVLDDGYSITADDLAATVQSQNTTLKSGDVVLLRTGKMRQFITDNPAFEAGCPGVSADGTRWLLERGMGLIGIDATSIDPLPTPDHTDTTHVLLLVEKGIHIIENLWLEELAGQGVYEFLFICLPLKVKGATGSWVRPIAVA